MVIGRFSRREILIILLYFYHEFCFRREANPPQKIVKTLLNRNACKIENKIPENRRRQGAYCPMRPGVKIPSLISVDILV